MVLLRRIYYRDLFGKELSDLAEEDKIIYIELTELLRNVRQFNSMIKRREDYNFVNMGIACILKERRDLMRQKLKETINRMKQLRRLNEKIPNTLILLDSLTKDENSFNILNMLFKNLRQNKFMFDSNMLKKSSEMRAGNFRATLTSRWCSRRLATDFPVTQTRKFIFTAMTLLMKSRKFRK